MLKNFVDKGGASEIALLEKEYGKGIVGDNQLEMTRFQKQVLLLEEDRKNKKAKQNQGVNSTNPSGTLNAQTNGPGYSETVTYKNENEFETENQAEFVD
jgi:hypothetical protein